MHDDNRYADSIYVVCAHCSTAFAWSFEDDPPADVLCGPCWFTREDCRRDDAIDDQRELARDRR